MKEMRVGIVGTGNIASKFARACAQTAGVRPAGVSSRSLEKGTRFAEENGIDRVYVGVDQIIRDPEIDLIYVATPHTAHFEICMAALQAGKPVLCEKPMAMRKADAAALFAEARKQGVFFMEGMWSRFLPNSLQAKAWIEEGRIGKVRFLDGAFTFAVDPEAPKPRLVNPALGGGAMFDLGVYTVEMASYYAGADPEEWSGLCVPYCPGTDGSSVLSVKYPDGILATLRMGITCETPVMMTIYGEKGRIELPRFFLANEVRLYENGQLTQEKVQRFALPEGFCWQIAAVRDYLEAGVTESPVVPASTTIATAQVMESMMHRFFPDRY